MSVETSSINLNRLYTADEFMRLSFEGDQQAELIEGRIIVPPPPGDEHGQIADEIRYQIFLADPERKLGKVWMNSRFQVTLDSAPAPDLAFVVTERVLPRSPGVVNLVPDLAVEVISPTDELKDIAKKLKSIGRATSASYGWFGRAANRLRSFGAGRPNLSHTAQMTN